MEWLTLGLFCAALLACLALDASILYALAFGLLVFLLYGRHRQVPWSELVRVALDGVKRAKNILITFLLIGVLTALWRAAGTIPVIVCGASTLIRPSVFLLTAFLINCGVSVLTGTSFGTAATVGAICASMGAALGVDARLIGGAVLSGVYFGDRCSPVSTSALLVAELTGTNIFDNIQRMLRSALLPFLLACGIYALLGITAAQDGELLDLRALFGREFTLHWAALLPAAVILLLAALRVNVKITMLASILCAVPLCLWLQHNTPAALLRAALFGFAASDPAVAAMTDGGGIVSMLKVGGIVCLSSSYAGIFERTGLLDGAKHGVAKLAARTTPFCAALCTSIPACMIACNQTLAVMLTEQLCAQPERERASLALDLEDTAIVIAGLVPWSIACGVPLAAAGAPVTAVPFACYLYLLPLCRLCLSCTQKRRARLAA
ncbi:MAG: sodium:proton antiporter [Oscillospiraceae bacterium]|nr:sodium:proton antiporter [Oscillospiraceae bacterium]